MNIQGFKSDLTSLSNDDIINKYYLSGPAFALGEDEHFTLRKKVAEHFSVSYTEVFLVGSAKLGFSIKPKRRFCDFGDTSDIDVVILSRDLYESIWKEVVAYIRTGGWWPKLTEFKEYHLQGWIRPDKLPVSKAFQLTKAWWEFFEKLSGSGEFGPYKITGGLYHSMFFLEKYQSKCFDQCRNEIS